MAELNESNRFKTGEFQGMVKTKLENIAESMKELKADVNILKRKVDNNRLKIAGIGATVSFIVTLLTLLIKEIITN